MSLSEADGLSGVRRRAVRALDRVASLLPTVRGRLVALVLMALVPALVILVYDEWLARQRGFAALTDYDYAEARGIAARLLAGVIGAAS
jgi:hypothetical protein